jgi:hypothetical protein
MGCGSSSTKALEHNLSLSDNESNSDIPNMDSSIQSKTDLKNQQFKRRNLKKPKQLGSLIIKPKTKNNVQMKLNVNQSFNSSSEIEDNEDKEEESSVESEYKATNNKFGVIIDESIKEIYQSDLSEDDVITMVANALAQHNPTQDKTKTLNTKQITVIGTIIYDALFSNYTFDKSKPIKHKSLKGILVKVTIQKLTLQLLKETYFKNKKVSKKNLERALKEIVGDSNLKDIKVLRIEIF